MRKKILWLLAIGMFLAASCGEGIKQRPLANKSATAFAPNSSSGDKAELKKIEKTPLEKYDLKFWDSLDYKTFPMPERRGKRFTSSVRHHGELARGRMHAAYRLGLTLASSDSASVEQRLKLIRMTAPSVVSDDSTAVMASNIEPLLIKCVDDATANGEYGMSAMMVSGYYFGHLATVLQNVNPDTQLPDERTLAQAINRLMNLKKYINQALTSEKDVKNTIILQNIQASADSVYITYNTISESLTGKFAKLLSQVSDVDKCFE